MRGGGADELVVAMKSGNADGAKELADLVSDNGQPVRGGAGA
jgi:hypothetical protein